MPVSELLELAKSGGYEEFEGRCLELIENDQLRLTQLVGPFQQLWRSGDPAKLATLAQMVLENADLKSDPPAALTLCKSALVAAPKSAELRQLTVDLYRMVYGDYVRFEVVLEASGLAGGRPVRSATRLLDVCLTLEPGDTLISRMDDRVVEVTEIDRENALFTLRRGGRATTLPANEVVREYDRIASDDFRVLRQLRPADLVDMMQDDPVRVVIGLIHSHGEMMSADMLKHDLVPTHIDARDWSKWWTRTKTKLKRSSHVIMEGRSPIMLSYCAEGQTLEDETWDTFAAHKEPADWVTTIERYLREKKACKETPEADFMRRFHDHIVKAIEVVRPRRVSEALAGALVIRRLEEKGLPATDESRELATEILRLADDPGTVLRGIVDEGLREQGMQVLRTVRPDDWHEYFAAWLPTAPAGLLDKLATTLIDAGQVDVVQSFIDGGLTDIARHPDLAYWLWKGPKKADDLNLPSDRDLFQMILTTLSELGRTVAAEDVVVKEFRHKMKAALALRSYARAGKTLEQISAAAAITVRQQMLRLEGLGANAPTRLLNLLRDVHPQLWVVKQKRIEPWEDSQTIWSTASGATRRVAARDEIVNVKMPANAVQIGEAASHGDLSENSEYKFALEERDLLRGQLARINDELSRSRTLMAEDVPEDHIGIGSRVVLRPTDGGPERVMTFLGPFDADADNRIYSYQAPVSQTLMGHHVGDHVTLTFDGRETEFEIAASTNALK